jgi:uncharacterized protein YndB with AHSA1/START domain
LDEALTVRRETFIAAPPAVVFAYLTDPEKIVSWMGAQSHSETRSGGVYLLEGVSRRRRTVRGAFREVVPVHRLAYSFGWDDSEAVPPGSSLIEIDLLDENGGTRMRMTHSGLPDAAQCANHAAGWAHYLSRLSVAAGGGDPGPDPM